MVAYLWLTREEINMPVFIYAKKTTKEKKLKMNDKTMQGEGRKRQDQ